MPASAAFPRQAWRHSPKDEKTLDLLIQIGETQGKMRRQWSGKGADRLRLKSPFPWASRAKAHAGAPAEEESLG